MSNVMAPLMFWMTPSTLLLAGGAARTSSSSWAANAFKLERRVEMTGNGCSDVEWTVDRKAQTWTVAVRGAPGFNWMGMGISENGGMKGADIMMVKRNEQDEFEVEDLFSSDYEKPNKDIMQNVELLEAYTDEQGSIRALLRRRLDTCDVDDIEVKSTKQYLICASGVTDSEGTILFHGPARSKALVNLFVDEELLIDRKFNMPPNTTRMEIGPGLTVPSNIYTSSQVLPVDVQMQDVTLESSTKTSYRCHVIQTRSDVNVVAVEAVWGDGKTIEDEPQPDYIHHQLLYRCDNVGLMDPATFDGKSYDCLENMP